VRDVHGYDIDRVKERPLVSRPDEFQPTGYSPLSSVLLTDILQLHVATPALHGSGFALDNLAINLSEGGILV